MNILLSRLVCRNKEDSGKVITYNGKYTEPYRYSK